jgi:hypothetical protein
MLIFNCKRGLSLDLLSSLLLFRSYHVSNVTLFSLGSSFANSPSARLNVNIYHRPSTVGGPKFLCSFTGLVRDLTDGLSVQVDSLLRSS